MRAHPERGTALVQRRFHPVGGCALRSCADLSPAVGAREPPTMAMIVVFGAGGKAGRRITAEAARRSHHVIAVARDRSQLTDLPAAVVPEVGDALSKTSLRKFARRADALIVAIGDADHSVWKRAAQMPTETLNDTPGASPRILHMGGGATLLTPDGKRFLDLPDFPGTLRGAAEGQAEALEFYRRLPNSRAAWTYVSPPPVKDRKSTRLNSSHLG